MIDQRWFIVVSGLPASGKTTLAQQIGLAFCLPLYDKDDILEALFDTLGPVNADMRQRLSRASDRVLARLVERSCGAVLTSFWRHPSDTGHSGTPCEWLGQLSTSVVEVHCRCDPETAVQRFLHRSRHPGHLDADRTPEALRSQFRRVAERGPLGVGRVIVVDTDVRPNPELLIREIRAVFAGG